MQFFKKEKKLKVCYIYQDQYPWEVRTEKIATTLAKEGIEVHIICGNRNGLPRKEKILRNLYIHRLPKGLNKLTRNLFNFPAFFSPFWIAKITHVVRRHSVDVIIIRDLPLSPAAYLVAKITGKPIIMDMAENYPAMIKDTWIYRGPKPLDYIIRNPILLGWLEKIIVPLMDSIIVVSKYSARRVEKMLKDNKHKIWIVSNTPMLDTIKTQCMSPLAKEICKRSNFVLLYVGGLEESRGLDIVIKAIPYLSKIIPDILFVIVGQGSSETKLRKLVSELNINKHVFFTGWIPHKEISSIIANSDICLIPHYVTEHTDTTIPNKIFDYMAQKKPIVVTQAKPLVEIVKTAKCGLVYYDKSPLSLYKTILQLVDSKYRERLGINGWIAVQKRFNWNYDKRYLFKALEFVLGLSIN